MAWLFTGAATLLAAGAVAAVAGRRRQASATGRALSALRRRAARSPPAKVDFSSLADLPPPVARYFRRVLTNGQTRIRLAELQQAGELRTDVDSGKWLPFRAHHVIVPPAPGFLWDARVRMPAGLHLGVVDSYVGGVGSGRVSLFSMFQLAAETGFPELDSGALHRYLAEAVWCPTALLPQSGVVWQAIDQRSARATLAHGKTCVSLEFRFDDAGEVTGIYTPGRYRRRGGTFSRTPWEGHFRDYRNFAGMRVPHYGEVGWFDQGSLKLVWKGRITGGRYEYEC